MSRQNVTLVRFVRDFKLGIKNLLLHKLRSFLTMLGLVFGVGSVIAMLAIGEGASQEALAQIKKLGSRNIILTAQKPAGDESSGKNANMSIYGLLYDDLQRISELYPSVTEVVPIKMLDSPGRFAKRSLDLRLVGTTEKWFEFVPRELLAGRILHKADLDAHSNVAVLTEYGARRLLANSFAIGDSLMINGQAYEIIGIVKNEGGSGVGSQTIDARTDAYIPLTTARERNGDINVRHSEGTRTREMIELNQIIVQVENEFYVEVTAKAIERMLTLYHKSKDYEVQVPLALLRQTEVTKRTFSIVLGAIAGISLLVGGIGIMNIMLASVTERTREIGIRRAIGARRIQIVMQFLIESLVLSALGGLIGMGLGVLIPMVVTYFADMPTVVTIESLILSLGISVSVGVIFGIYPAMRASELDPIIALRHD